MNRAVGLMVARGWMNVCAIASFLIVGRFLSPTEFGIYALASSGIMLPMTLIGAGYADHVISRDQDKHDEATAFWSTAGLGGLFSVAALVAALILPFVGLPEIGKVLLVLSPLPMLWGFSAILEAMLIRDNRAGLMAGFTVAAETLGLIALIASVMMGLGVMSLAISRLVNNGLLLVIYWVLVRPPSWRKVNREAAGRLTRFSIGVVGARIMNWADAYGVEFVIGALLPTALVGFYRMAGRLSAALGSILIFAPWQAQLAYLGERLKAAPHRGGMAMLRALQLHMCLIAPLFAGLSMLAHDVIDLLLGPRWDPTGDVLAIMGVAAILQVVYGVLVAMLIARGATQRLFYFQVVIVVSTSLALAIGATWGLDGAALAKFVVSGLLFVAGPFVLAELSALQRARIIQFLLGLAAACAALVIAMFLVSHLLPQGDDVLSMLTRIIVGSIVGLVAYLATLRLTASNAVRLLMLVARNKWRARRASTPLAEMAEA